MKHWQLAQSLGVCYDG